MFTTLFAKQAQGNLFWSGLGGRSLCAIGRNRAQAQNTEHDTTDFQPIISAPLAAIWRNHLQFWRLFGEIPVGVFEFEELLAWEFKDAGILEASSVDGLKWTCGENLGGIEAYLFDGGVVLAACLGDKFGRR